MVKLFCLCRRRPDVTHDRYADLLLHGHVPLALRHHTTLRRYVVNIVAHCPPGWPEFDSIGELSFDSFADFRERLYDSEAARVRVERDAAGFMGGADAYATTPHVQKAPSAPLPLGQRSPVVKLVCPVLRRPELTHEQFVAHWLGTHVPLALKHHPGLSAYVTNVVDQRLSPTGLDLDGIAELHFPSEAALQTQFFDSPEGERIIFDDIARFIGRSTMYPVAAYPQR